jgi:hypothetical protein
VRLADRIIQRVRAASFEELSSGAFLAREDGDEETVEPDDASRVAEAVVSALAKKNQFAASEPRLVEGVTRITSDFFATRDYAKASSSFLGLFRGFLGEAPREVTSATYSPELQLRILSLSIDALEEPILDVGCGEDASLVRHLRAAGKNARGVDREAPLDMGDRADWLAYDYGVGKWGTILSHLGFSLHFMHQEMKSSDLAFDYGKTYMRILRSLAKGGTFAYVPGLPFIEPMLPATDFDVKRIPLARELFTENVARVQEATGLMLQAATHVVRR